MEQKKLPHEIKSEETKQKIMDAARRLLAEHDFKYLTVRNICEESGAAYGSFYHHFSSKENLLYIYTDQLYQEMCRQNPLPDWIDEGDYLKNVLWYMIVYGCFCEAAGKNLIRYLHEKCPQDMFRRTMEEKLIPAIRQARENGFLDEKRDRQNGKDASSLLIKDISIVCKGVVFWWCSTEADEIREETREVRGISEPVPEAQGGTREMGHADRVQEHLYETLEHLAFNMLFSFSSQKYQEADFPHCLVTEMPEFEGSIRIPDLGFGYKGPKEEKN